MPVMRKTSDIVAYETIMDVGKSFGSLETTLIFGIVSVAPAVTKIIVPKGSRKLLCTS